MTWSHRRTVNAVWRGTLQGAAQALIGGTLMTLSSELAITYNDYTTPAPAFEPVLLGSAGTLLTVGFSVDWRRRWRPLELVAPRGARAVLGAVVAAAGLAILIVADLDACGIVLIGGSLLFIALDRILGPAWVLGRLLRASWERRRWSRHEVVEADEARSLLEDASGRPFGVRTEQPLALGPAYFELERWSNGELPYRDDEARALVLRHETLGAREDRAHAVGTAALALLSGLAWLSLPFFTSLGSALTQRG